ncbi:hypothetical protein M8J76_009887 [Diaphorina citri]|nr:hypothetical protein M8J76_009887 [Diaphorina citri]
MPEKEKLSGATVVIFIAGGVLTFIILFIFAKNQIMRFALRSRRGPHVPIGHDAKKSYRREIERRIECIPRILCEPRLLPETDSKYILPPGSNLPPYYYRMKTVDDVNILEKEVARHDPLLIRHPSVSVRSFLINTLATPVNGVGQRMVHQFCDLYEHARYDPNDFGDEEYQMYSKLLLKLMDAAKLLKPYATSRKSSPSRTPIKKQTLDRSRTHLDVKRDRKSTGDEDVYNVISGSRDNTETTPV